MAFPAVPRDVTVEILINESWVDISTYVMQRSPITIVRGSGGENDSVPPTTMSLLLNNEDGRFSQDNPMSPYWPYFSVACQIRLKITEGGTDYYRFWGETQDAPEATEKARTDNYISLHAHSYFGRWQRSRKPDSPMRRTTLASTNLVAYWPMEDEGENAQVLAAATPSTSPMIINSAIDIASESSLDCTKPIPSIGNGQVTFSIPTYRSTNNAVFISFLIVITAVAADQTTILSVRFNGGTISRLSVLGYINGDMSVRAYDRDGGVISTFPLVGLININNAGSWVSLRVSQSGADVHVELEARSTLSNNSASVGGDFTSQTIGTATLGIYGMFNNLGASIGHTGVFTGALPTSFSDLSQAIQAYAGESAGARFIRNCRENGIEFRYWGQSLNSTMGPQPIDTLYAILRECADVEHSVIFEAREYFGLMMITRAALYNQGTRVRLPPDMNIKTTSSSTTTLITYAASFDYRFWPGVEFQLRVVATDALVSSTVYTVVTAEDQGNDELLVTFTPAAPVTPTAGTHEISILRTAVASFDYSASDLVLPFRPARDNRLAANRVLASRKRGSNYLVEDRTSPRGSADPPEGIGLYEIGPTLNLYSDAQLPLHAGWELGIGTNDEPRYPSLEINFASASLAAKQAEILTADIGHLITIDNAETAWLYRQQRQHAMGYTETLSTIYGHELALNTVPARPYQVGVWNETTDRWAAASTSLAQDITSAQTGAVSVSVGQDVWTTSAGDFPLDVVIGGELVTLSGISGGVGSISFVSAGTSSAADNASVTPGLPAGLVNGDVVLILVSIRNTAATVNTPSGWTASYTQAGTNFRLLSRVYNSAVWTTMPTVTVSGGSAGNTVIAQSAAFRGISLLPTKINSPVSSSHIDIAVRTSAMNSVHGQYGLRLVCGNHFDDWTSVVPPSGLDEIEEIDSTLGSDMGQVWAYAIDGISANFPGTKGQAEFTVTGGTAAANKSFVVFFGASPQTFTISARSVNNVIKSHSTGASIDIAEPDHYAL